MLVSMNGGSAVDRAIHMTFASKMKDCVWQHVDWNRVQRCAIDDAGFVTKAIGNPDLTQRFTIVRIGSLSRLVTNRSVSPVCAV